MKTVVIGDVHGCYQELRNLIGAVDLRHNDRLAFVGDLVDRGPDSIGVIRYVKNLMHSYPGSVCVAGNHEVKTLYHLWKGQYRRPWVKDATEEDIKFLESLPLYARLPDLNAIVIHGGFFPRFFDLYPEVGLDDKRCLKPNWQKGGGKYMNRARRVLFTRWVNPEGNSVSLGKETDEDQHWSQVYEGQEGFAFFGHDPKVNPPEPRYGPHALGLDTGVCFSGKLTAAIITDDVRNPEIVQSDALAKYAEPMADR